MDVLRGFAILGIFIANLKSLTWYGVAGPDATGSLLQPNWDEKMLFLHHMFIEGKFYSIFSFLFGWGVALQLMRLEAKGTDPRSFVRRRLAIMLLLGAFHLLLWPGDIVFFYALLGFLLLPLLRLSNKTLVITAVLLLLSPILLYALKMNFPVLRSPTMMCFGMGEWTDAHVTGITSNESFEAYMKKANWIDIMKADLGGFFFRYGDLFHQSRISKVLGMMLLGAVVGRTDFYKKMDEHKKLLYYIIAFGILIAIPANYMLAGYMQDHDGAYENYKTAGLYRTLAYAVGVAPLAATYIALFMFTFRSGAGKKIFSVLAPVGKMAFSNYIMHTLIGNFIFLPAGLGYLGKMGPVYYTIFAILIFVCQIIFSTAWLKYFNYGPLEWLWRSVTYKKWQPMKKLPVLTA